MASLRNNAIFALALIFAGCSQKQPDVPSSSAAIQSASFAIVETELSPAILVHSQSKYLDLFRDAPGHLAFATRSGPRPFKRGERLRADEMEESWIVLWDTNLPPWVVYLQHKPRALSFDTNGLHFSFTNVAGDVVLLPLHGSSTNVDTKKWPEFLTREPLLRIRYWASALREFPIECNTTVAGKSVQQQFRFHSIRDDWNTKPLKLAPMSPPLTAMVVDERLRRALRDLKMPTSFGPYMGFEGVSEWKADFPAQIQYGTNCSWVSVGDCKVSRPNTRLVDSPRPSVTPNRGNWSEPTKQRLLNPSTRLIAYD